MPEVSPVDVEWVSVEDKLPPLVCDALPPHQVMKMSSPVLLRSAHGGIFIGARYANADQAGDITEDRDEHGAPMWTNLSYLDRTSWPGGKTFHVTHWGRVTSSRRGQTLADQDEARPDPASS